MNGKTTYLKAIDVIEIVDGDRDGFEHEYLSKMLAKRRVVVNMDAFVCAVPGASPGRGLRHGVRRTVRSEFPEFLDGSRYVELRFAGPQFFLMLKEDYENQFNSRAPENLGPLEVK